jgi:hypothetical protein
MRTSLRVRLEDSGSSPLFSDGDLNEMLAQALGEYGSIVPKMARTTVAVAADATAITLPGTVSDYAMVALRDATGADVRPLAARGAGGPLVMAGYEQAWRAVAGTIALQRRVLGAEAGSWTIEYRTGRTLPATDGETMPVEAGDEAAVIELAMARVYDRKVFEDYKRGFALDLSAELADKARQRATDMLRHRTRGARMGWVDV